MISMLKRLRRSGPTIAAPSILSRGRFVGRHKVVDAFQETMAGAEVLAPGIQLPTLDRAAPPATTFKSICGLRRAALDRAATVADTRDMIASVTGNRMIDTKTATCRDVRATFRSVVAMKKVANKGGVADTKTGGVTNINVAQGPKSLAELNKLDADLYNKKKAG